MAFSAFLDTCVLVPSLQRDILLEAACAHLYRPLWSDRVEEELGKTLEGLLREKGLSVDAGQNYICRLLNQMNDSLPDTKVNVPLVSSPRLRLQLPDPGDCHIVEAAMLGRADVIVTHNLRHFPDASLPGALFSQSLDNFLSDLLSHNPAVMGHVLNEIAGRSGRKGPVWSVEDILLTIKRETPQFVRDISNYLQAIR